jgi:dipeptidyl aminopeptidase/acylaminoacyl peptidase
MTDIRTEDVTFYSGPALKLAGRIFHPAGSSRAPAIVMCHGTAGVKEENPVGMAKLLAGAGYRALTFDYRGFGGSEGYRGRLVPAEQMEDVACAADYLASRDDVDPARIGVYGASMGARMAAGALLQSDTIRCAALTVPAVFGARRETGAPTQAHVAMMDRTRAALKRKVVSGEIEIVQRSEIIGNALTAARDKGKDYPLALESMVHIGRGIHPVDWAPHIKIPVLVAAIETDGQIPFEIVKQFYARLSGEKKFHTLPQGNHYSVYEELLPDTFAAARAWFDAHLSVPAQDNKAG